MSKQKCPRLRICKCGRRFRQSEKFANERMCSRCYRAHSDKFIRWLDSLSDEELSEVHSHMKEAAHALGITAPQPELVPVAVDPEQVPAHDQDRVDATFYELMKEVNL